MPQKTLIASFVLLGLACFMFAPGGNCQTNRDYGDLEKLYKELKMQKPDKDVEIHYLKETIIQEPSERDEYLKHLLEELHKSLQKGKKWGTVRRVEGGLVEIDKGAVHKIRERDVYIVQDASGKYKSKMEVEAIADAISIGTSYGQKKSIEPGDVVKFRGQRKRLELGLTYGFSENEHGKSYSGLGMLWEYNLRSGWGGDFLVTFFKRDRDFSLLLGDYRESVSIPLSLGVRKYLYYPFWVSPFVGFGEGYLKIEDQIFTNQGVDTVTIVRLIPYLTIGTQLSGEQFHLNLEARYFYGPELKFEQETVKFRPIIYCASIAFTW